MILPQSLSDLANRLKNMPKPADEQGASQWSADNNFCDAITLSFDDEASRNEPAPQRLKSLEQAGFAVEMGAYMRGGVDDRIRILRAMYLIAMAAMAGKPEPDGAQILALQAAPLMDESKIPEIFRKAKAGRKQERGSAPAGPSAAPALSGVVPPPAASPASSSAPPDAPPERKRWWRFW